MGVPTPPGDTDGCRGVGMFKISSCPRKCKPLHPCLGCGNLGIACPPSHLAQQSAFDGGLWGPCPFLPGASLARFVPSLGLPWGTACLPCSGKGPVLLCQLPGGTDAPLLCPRLGGWPWRQANSSPITSGFVVSSLSTETKGEDATATQCQGADHQTVPSRQGRPCCRECRP